jgi:signal transduction histidine kinase
MFILIYGLAFSYKHDSANKEKITSIKALGGIIAHGLRTPLAVITGCAEIIENIIAKLSINTKSSDDFDLETLKRAQSSIENVGLKASTLIDMFLMKIREENYVIEIKEYSIKGVIDDAILSYPINQKEKELIEIRVEEDFKFKGDDLLIKHVLYNLLENALYFIKDAGKGNITIWSKKTYAFNLLHFRDTGKGIKQELKKNIFNKFYTTTKRGTGLGLYFCKLILNELGGDIICASEENVYTEFILKFPAIKGL